MRDATPEDCGGRGGGSDHEPGPINLGRSYRVRPLSVTRATGASLHDGLRYQNIEIHVSTILETTILFGAEVGERGALYGDLTR